MDLFDVLDVQRSAWYVAAPITICIRKLPLDWYYSYQLYVDNSSRVCWQGTISGDHQLAFILGQNRILTTSGWCQTRESAILDTERSTPHDRAADERSATRSQ